MPDHFPTNQEIITWVDAHGIIVLCAFYLLSSFVSYIPATTPIGKFLHGLVGNLGYVFRKWLQPQVGSQLGIKSDPLSPPGEGTVFSEGKSRQTTNLDQ